MINLQLLHLLAERMSSLSRWDAEASQLPLPTLPAVPMQPTIIKIKSISSCSNQQVHSRNINITTTKLHSFQNSGKASLSTVQRETSVNPIIQISKPDNASTKNVELKSRLSMKLLNNGRNTQSITYSYSLDNKNNKSIPLAPYGPKNNVHIDDRLAGKSVLASERVQIVSNDILSILPKHPSVKILSKTQSTDEPNILLSGSCYLPTDKRNTKLKIRSLPNSKFSSTIENAANTNVSEINISDRNSGRIFIMANNVSNKETKHNTSGSSALFPNNVNTGNGASLSEAASITANSSAVSSAPINKKVVWPAPHNWHRLARGQKHLIKIQFTLINVI